MSAAKALVAVKTVPEFVKDLGKVIYIYKEIYTNQVVYSLYRSLRNKDAMKQLTFVGKQSVPRALRKDRWAPMCKVFLPTPIIGLTTFRMLREFRTMHETQYDPKLLKLPKEERKKTLMDQKLNSIADLAESLKIALDQAPEKDRKEEIVIKWQYHQDLYYAKVWPPTVLHDWAKRPERYTHANEGSEASDHAKKLLEKKKRKLAAAET